MTPTRTLRPLLVRRAVLAAAAGVAVAVALVVPGGERGPAAGPRPGGVTTTNTARGAAAAQAFFDRYVEADGRVVRHDQGGDTVSEGQAYAMLIAVATHDEVRFHSVWDWTRRNLQRSDGLLSWHWRDGAVVDRQPAADADVDAARALFLAAERFDRPDLRAEASRIAGAVLDHEVVTAGARSALAAGPWAVGERVVNPGYFSPCANADLARATGDRRWQRLADDSVALIESATRGGRQLPPDWSRLDGAGTLQPAAGPTGKGGAAGYGLDAARVPLRLAERCNADGDADDAGRRLAAELWPTLRGLAQGGSGVLYRLDGTPAGPADARHPTGLIGAAAAAGAAGDRPAATRLLDEAAALDRQAPTYYGAALLALGEAFPPVAV
jgi:endoglucanase